MHRTSDRTPDGIQPLVGYRAWTYAFEGTGAALYPLGGPLPDIPNPWAGAESTWVVATCRNADLDLDALEALVGPIARDHLDNHGDVPDERCSCGFYSMKTLDALLQGVHISPREEGESTGCILGRIELAGKIIEHDLGYRAERARIAQLIPFETDLENGICLAWMLGVELGDPVPKGPHSPPPDDASSLRLRVRDWMQSVAA